MPSVRGTVATADGMRALGEIVGAACRAGDLVLLVGDLGAGKTTLAQGIARGIGIDEQVTSPTFVISRVHAHPSGGPDLVHVDAYRLGAARELDDLDVAGDDAVLVVEWGEGLVDGLSDRVLVVRIGRHESTDADEMRDVLLEWDGAAWGDDLARLESWGAAS